MIVYRLSKLKYKNDLSGRGAEIAGGRWNSKGIPMLYTADSRALCTTEIAVHTPLGILPDDFFMVFIEIPDDEEINEIKAIDLEEGWRSFPHSAYTQKKGDQFIKQNKSLVLKVPSAVVAGDYNYLINPLHKMFHRVKITHSEAFQFDKRLFK